jgi:hypothetical protein
MDIEFSLFKKKCTATLWRGGESKGIHQFDVILSGGEFWVVLEWNDTPQGSIPFIRAHLEKQWLQEAPDCFVYQHQIYWPEAGG